MNKHVNLVNARASVKAPKFENADEQMIVYNQWVLWNYDLTDKGKLTKVPYSVNASGQPYKASTTNPNTWLSFELAKATYETGGFSGIGFVFTDTDPFLVADFDHVISGDRYNQIAR